MNELTTKTTELVDLIRVSKKQSAVLKKTTDAIAELKAELLEEYQEQGLQNMKLSDNSLAFIRRNTNWTTDNWEEFYTFVSENNMSQLLQKNPRASAVNEYVADTGKSIPGVSKYTYPSLILKVSK
tara:strand:- start:418 stop:795 length:378 start_codon:yes stop_codon:yes gene_type:complete